MTNEDVDFIKSMCLQGSDMTDRQERRVRRIIDDMRMFVSASRSTPTEAKPTLEREEV